MAVRIRETDTFILERNENNYHVTGKDIRDYVPPFEAGVKCVFFQSRAPLEWTNISTPNNVTIKIVHTDVNTSGGGRTLGSLDFTTVFKSSVSVPMPSHTHGFSQGNHSHSITGNAHGHGSSFNKNHSHTSSGGGSHAHTAKKTTWTKTGKDHSSWSGGTGTSGTQSADSSSSGSTTYNANKSGVSVKGANVTGATVAKTLGIGTSNPTDVGGSNSPKINMQLKYRDCIICSKDPY
jgi:hypothetical protein